MIKAENAKFAREFSSPHTSMYTGVHESIDQILDPKYVFMCDCYCCFFFRWWWCARFCEFVHVCAVLIFPRRTSAPPALSSSPPALFPSLLPLTLARCSPMLFAAGTNRGATQVLARPTTRAIKPYCIRLREVRPRLPVT